MANATDVHFLGRIPMEQKSRECGDAGIPILLKYPDSKTSEIFYQIAKKVHELFE